MTQQRPKSDTASMTAPPPAGLGVLFVLIWSTGFIVARGQAPYGEPLTFVAIRFALAGVIFAAVALAMRRTLRIGWQAAAHNLVAGALLHGVYLGSVFYAVSIGMPTAIAALFQSTAPIFTAILAGPLLGERITARQWAGLAISLAGVAITLSPKFGTTGFTLLPIAVSACGLTGLVFGGFYQRLFVAHVDMRVANTYQYAGGVLILLPFVLALEPLRLVTHPVYLLAMAWAVLVLSIGAFTLYIHFLRRGAVTKASSLMFLVPTVTSVMAWAMFGETLTPVQIAGGVITLAGVVLGQRR